MSLSAFLSSAAGALAVIVVWQAAQWWLRRRHPQPGPGETICYNCRITGGHNLRLEAVETAGHLRAHVAMLPGTEVVMGAKWRQEDL